MDAKNKGSISLFALVLIAIIGLGMGSQIVCNFSVYQLSQGYHVMRERLLIKGMIGQVLEEAVLSKYELFQERSSESLAQILDKEVAGSSLAFDSCRLSSNRLRQSYNGIGDFVSIFEGAKSEIGLLSCYLARGPHIDLGKANVTFEVHGRSYEVEAIGYGIPLSNFDQNFYELPESGSTSQQIYALGERGEKIPFSQNGANRYQNRQEVSLLSHAYSFIWEGDFLQKLVTENPSALRIDIPSEGLEVPGIEIDPSSYAVSIDLNAITSDLICISDPEGLASIRFLGEGKDASLTLVVYNNSGGSKTKLAVDHNIKNTLVLYALNTEISFRNSLNLKGALFLDPSSIAMGSVSLDGHFSCSKSTAQSALNLNFARTDAVKLQLAQRVPHVFMTQIKVLDS